MDAVALRARRGSPASIRGRARRRRSARRSCAAGPRRSWCPGRVDHRAAFGDGGGDGFGVAGLARAGLGDDLGVGQPVDREHAGQHEHGDDGQDHPGSRCRPATRVRSSFGARHIGDGVINGRGAGGARPVGRHGGRGRVPEPTSRSAGVAAGAARGAWARRGSPRVRARLARRSRARRARRLRRGGHGVTGGTAHRAGARARRAVIGTRRGGHGGDRGGYRRRADRLDVWVVAVGSAVAAAVGRGHGVSGAATSGATTPERGRPEVAGSTLPAPTATPRMAKYAVQVPARPTAAQRSRRRRRPVPSTKTGWTAIDGRDGIRAPGRWVGTASLRFLSCGGGSGNGRVRWPRQRRGRTRSGPGQCRCTCSATCRRDSRRCRDRRTRTRSSRHRRRRRTGRARSRHPGS